MARQFIDTPMRIRCRSKIRFAVTRGAVVLLCIPVICLSKLWDATYRFAKYVRDRGMAGVRYDIEIKDGYRWVPIVKAERLMEAR